MNKTTSRVIRFLSRNIAEGRYNEAFSPTCEIHSRQIYALIDYLVYKGIITDDMVQEDVVISPLEDSPENPPVIMKRGKPPKEVVVNEEAPIKRKRGRPRKNPL